jgi:hypothetical protein
MIKGKRFRTDTSYFQKEKDSSSSLKMFADDKRKYKKYIIDGKKREDEENKAMLIGNIVDCQISTPEEFDNRFYTSTEIEVPTGAMLTFINALYKNRETATDELGVVTLDFQELAELAYSDAEIKKPKFEAFIEKFNKEGRNYFDLLCQTKPKNLTVISPMDLENAGKVIDGLRSSENTGRIIRQINDDRYDVYNQLIIECEVFGLEMKMMLDKVEVDNEEKTITPRDIKVTWNVEDFYKEYYLYRKAYIQEAVYHIGVQEWAKINYPDYVVKPFEFVVADSINYMHPLIYQSNSVNLDKAINGFIHNNTKHKGVKQLIEELIWHKENNVWDISYENYKNNGIVRL